VSEWDPVRLAITPAPSCLGPAFDRPRELALPFVTERLEYVEKRTNGRDVYKNAKRDITVKTDPGRGYWKLIAPEPASETTASAFSLAEAEADALTLFDTFSLPREQADNIIRTDVGGGESDGRWNVFARHVRIHRQVNGVRVLGSRFMVTYSLDGKPYRIELRWPEIKLKASPKLHTRAEAIEEVSNVIAPFFEGKEVFKVLTDLAYRYDEEDGTFEPVLSVWVFQSSDFETPEAIEYSLIDGFKEKPEAKPVVDA
jgi:hypothetical protein